ncbi:hypothetical protein [Paractinoplanes globisporus]|jgi:hypothetical protein|uniref:Uncharacterized protein n=1 Tax=Paractinoplanes globisporus TaxID=113565 RepID=A0ABW6WF64_9ACTN|nr:hypothetical protein [Actinoplanes globisporus]
MLLQGSPSVRQQTAHEEPSARPRGNIVAPPVTPSVRGRNYPPITWDHPSLGKVVAEGIGGITKTTLLLILVGAVFIGAAMAIALVVTGVVSAFGVDASAGY